MMSERGDIEERAAAILQSAFHMHQCRQRYQQIVKMHKQRTNIAAEILLTERYYVSTLKLVVEELVMPLRTASPSIISSADIKVIFSDIEIIYHVNQNLLADLEARMNKWSPAQKLGDVFLKTSDFLRVYITYVNNFAQSKQRINELKNHPFKSFCETRIQGMPGEFRFLMLDDFLIRPIQRTPRYTLLLQQLLRNTWEDHVDYHDLSSALDKMLKVVENVNGKISADERMAKFLELQNTVLGINPRELISASRYFVKEGEVTEVPRKGSEKAHFLVLFNDLLLYCKVHSSLFRKSQNRWELQSSMPLKGARLVLPADIPGGKSITICCKSLEEKNEWVKAMTAAIEDTNKKEAFHEEQVMIAAQNRADQARMLIQQQYATLRLKSRRSSSCPPPLESLSPTLSAATSSPPLTNYRASVSLCSLDLSTSPASGGTANELEIAGDRRASWKTRTKSIARMTPTERWDNTKKAKEILAQIQQEEDQQEATILDIANRHKELIEQQYATIRSPTRNRKFSSFREKLKENKVLMQELNAEKNSISKTFNTTS